MRFQIHYFSDESAREFVLISSRTVRELIDDYAGDGYTLIKSLEILGDATDLPCDRILSEP